MQWLDALYKTGLSIRKIIYSSELKKRHKLDSRVISVGNLTMGGTGKTPATIAIAREAIARGYKPCILTRGYKGKHKGVAFVSRGKGPLLDSSEAGDEPVLMANRLEDVFIVKGKNRYDAGLLCQDQVDLYILDDGFQHWALHRDIDILLINSQNPFGSPNPRLFPSGQLREPLTAIGRADYVVITKSVEESVSELMLVPELMAIIRTHNKKAPVFKSYHKPVGLVDSNWNFYGLETIRGRRVYAFCGIAEPESFRKTLVSLGVEVVALKEFRDHYDYKQSDIKRILWEARGMAMITTEKDLIRLVKFGLPPHLKALSIEFSISDKFYDAILGRKTFKE